MNIEYVYLCYHIDNQSKTKSRHAVINFPKFQSAIIKEAK